MNVAMPCFGCSLLRSCWGADMYSAARTLGRYVLAVRVCNLPGAGLCDYPHKAHKKGTISQLVIKQHCLSTIPP
jgi:hypothetical protein